MSSVAPAPRHPLLDSLRGPILLIAVLILQIFSLQTPVLGQQAANATFTGTVTDPTGAVVAGFRVAATQKATGIRRETVAMTRDSTSFQILHQAIMN